MVSRSLTFWQPMPTPHVFALAEAMVDHFGQVRFVTLDVLEPGRAALGWATANSARVSQIHAGNPQEVRALIEGFDGPGDVHVLPGLKPTSWLRAVQRVLLRSRARIIVMAEAALPQPGWQAAAQQVRDRALAAYWRGRIELILAMGAIGVAHYRAIGFAAGQVREFGYFPELSAAVPPDPSDPAPGARLVFAGRLIHRKGLDVALDALACATTGRWTLRVVGDGPERARLEAQASALGLGDRIEWLGAAMGDAVPAILAAADLAIVPSRFDGWGAVTNEALGVGTPVLASDRCGSAAVLSRPELGAVFPSRDAVALGAALDAFSPKRGRRTEIRSWAHEHLSPAAGAVYLVRLIAGDGGAMPPWRSTPDPES